MLRNIIEIDSEKCTGCGACADACHQGAIQMVDGKAKLMREDHCDGLGKCLPTCPVDAIKIVEKDVVVRDAPCCCPSTAAKPIAQEEAEEFSGEVRSHLNQWPCQIKLANPLAPYFNQ